MVTRRAIWVRQTDRADDQARREAAGFESLFAEDWLEKREALIASAVRLGRVDTGNRRINALVERSMQLATVVEIGVQLAAPADTPPAALARVDAVAVLLRVSRELGEHRTTSANPAVFQCTLGAETLCTRYGMRHEVVEANRNALDTLARHASIMATWADCEVDTVIDGHPYALTAQLLADLLPGEPTMPWFVSFAQAMGATEYLARDMQLLSSRRPGARVCSPIADIVQLTHAQVAPGVLSSEVNVLIRRFDASARKLNDAIILGGQLRRPTPLLEAGTRTLMSAAEVFTMLQARFGL